MYHYVCIVVVVYPKQVSCESMIQQFKQKRAKDLFLIDKQHKWYQGLYVCYDQFLDPLQLFLVRSSKFQLSIWDGRECSLHLLCPYLFDKFITEFHMQGYKIFLLITGAPLASHLWFWSNLASKLPWAYWCGFMISSRYYLMFGFPEHISHKCLLNHVTTLGNPQIRS